jgi:hypothetical protein
MAHAWHATDGATTNATHMRTRDIGAHDRRACERAAMVQRTRIATESQQRWTHGTGHNWTDAVTSTVEPHTSGRATYNSETDGDAEK